MDITYEIGLLAHKLRLLEKLGITVPLQGNFLDFGCGAGRTVAAATELGFEHTHGYDIKPYLEDELTKDERFKFNKPGNYIMPYTDDFFDFIVSDQVFEHVVDQNAAFREIYRILKPGGCCIHIIPAKYTPIELHINVPLGSIIGSRHWYKLWAMLGVRNEFQKDLSANEVADRNAYYYVQGLRYIGNSVYRVLWDEIGFKSDFVTKTYLELSDYPKTRTIAKLAKVFPPAISAIHTLHSRVVYLAKPTDTENSDTGIGQHVNDS